LPTELIFANFRKIFHLIIQKSKNKKTFNYKGF